MTQQVDTPLPALERIANLTQQESKPSGQLMRIKQETKTTVFILLPDVELQGQETEQVRALCEKCAYDFVDFEQAMDYYCKHATAHAMKLRIDGVVYNEQSTILISMLEDTLKRMLHELNAFRESFILELQELQQLGVSHFFVDEQKSQYDSVSVASCIQYLERLAGDFTSYDRNRTRGRCDLRSLTKHFPQDRN